MKNMVLYHYTKDKERVFKCIPLYSMYCFPGNPIELTSEWKQISYKKNNLIQCVEIMDRRVPNV